MDHHDEDYRPSALDSTSRRSGNSAGHYMILSDFEFLDPENLAMCQRIFDQVCIDTGVDRTSSRAEELAATVLTIFQLYLGATEAELLAALRGRADPAEGQQCGGAAFRQDRGGPAPLAGDQSIRRA